MQSLSLSRISEEGAALPSAHALYVHIPFCAVHCSYCAFNVFTGLSAHIPAYVAALQNELGWLGASAQQTTADNGPLPVRTVYFGGGTPSLLSAPQIAALLGTIRTAFAVDSAAEITLEANPGNANAPYLASLREIGVNRLSIGMQSENADELALMTRDHDAATTAGAVAAARAAGFDNISLDLIFALPGQSLATWLRSVQAALALAPAHLSMYALELEPGTAMTHNVTRGALPLPDEDLAAAMYEAADDLATAAGLRQYEISNWARPGRECAHNQQYWRYGPYLGVGAGAHGFAAGARTAVVRSLKSYIARAGAQRAALPFPLTAAVADHTLIDEPTAMLEFLFTGLRQVRDGVRFSAFAARFGQPLEAVYGPQIVRLCAAGLLAREGDTLRLTSAARLISNRVFLELA